MVVTVNAINLQNIAKMDVELQSDMFRGVDEKHRNATIKLKTVQLANDDLEKYFRLV